MDDIIISDAILVFALRYALGRRTTAPSIVDECIRSNVDSLSDGIVDLLVRIIEEHGKSYSYGDDCDRITWLGLVVYLKNGLERRRVC